MDWRNQRGLRGTARDEGANQTRMELTIGTFSLPSLSPSFSTVSVLSKDGRAERVCL